MARAKPIWMGAIPDRVLRDIVGAADHRQQRHLPEDA